MDSRGGRVILGGMETATLIPESRALLNDIRRVFNIVMIYEDADAGRRVKRFSDKLLYALGDEYHYQRNLWSFDVLAITNVRNAAAGVARAADVVIVSASGNHDLSIQVEKWLDLWAWLTNETNPALVALFENTDGRSAQEIRRRLRALTANKQLGFFPHTTFEPSANLLRTEREFLTGSRGCYSDRAATVDHGATAAQPRKEHLSCVGRTAER